MSRVRAVVLGVLAIGAFAVAPSAASALTLGAVPFPAPSGARECLSSAGLVQQASTSLFTVPAGGGSITSWSTEAVPGSQGQPLTLLVLRANGGTYNVVGVDSEILPTPVPVSGVASFDIAAPIAVNAGDLLGLYSTSNKLACYFEGLGAGNALLAGALSSVSVGGTLTPVDGGEGYELDVQAELAQSEDVAVSAAATPASITAGGLSEFLFTISDNGIASEPVTFTDTVPGGLSIISAVAGSGSCTVAAQQVTCTTTGLKPGSSAPVAILVSAPAAGSYPDTASVALANTALSDPNPANNSASATLTVAAPAPPACQTLKLARFPLAIAKAVIPALHCKVGKVTLKASRTVHKGLVISTSPGAGVTLTSGTAVNLVVSSGPAKKKKKK